MYRRNLSLLLLLLVAATPLYPRTRPPTVELRMAVYVVVYRTPGHIRYSSSKVFHGFADDLLSYLKEKHVPLVVDPERGTIETASYMSVKSMLNIARQLGGTSLLYVKVDRPLTKWIKVTVEAYDMDGKRLWKEESSDAGSLTGKRGFNKTLDRIEAKLEKHLGGPGLPVAAPDPPGEANTP